MANKFSIQKFKETTTSVITEAALATKKQTVYLINPPKKLVTNPKLRRIIFTFFLLLLIFIIIVISFVKPVYDLESNSQTASLAARLFPYPAAIVGKKAVTIARLKSDITLVTHFIDYTKTTDRYQDINIKANLFERLIEAKLVEKIANQYDIKVSQEEIDNAWNTILVEQDGIGDVERILEELHGVSERQFKYFIYETLLREKVEELPKRRHAWHILLTFDKNDQSARDKTLQTLNELKKKIDEGAKFEDIAKENSQDLKSRDAGGDLGWVDTAFQLEGQEEPAFRDTIFQTEVNKIADPVESHLGFHLVKSVEEKGSVAKSMKQMIDEARLKVRIIRFVKL